MKNNLKDKRILVFLGLLVASLVLFKFVLADDKSLSYFEDRDGDGLSDEEEKALGTDWQKADTDGDGYTDGVEIKNGFNPLVPAPGDRIGSDTKSNSVNEFDNNHKKTKNLTKEFIAKLQSRKKTAIDTFKSASQESGIVTDVNQLEKLKNLSITNEDINTIVEETIQDTDVDKEIALIDSKEFNILPKVESKNNRKKREEIKKQLEEYVAQVGFIMVNSLPFQVDDNDDFNEKLEKFMLGISDDIVLGSDLETKNSKSKLARAFGELKKIKTPYVVRDVHIKIVSLIKYLLEQDEEIVFQKDDPIAMGLMIGRLQGVVSEIQDEQVVLEGILEKYGVGFSSTGNLENNDSKIVDTDVDNGKKDNIGSNSGQNDIENNDGKSDSNEE